MAQVKWLLAQRSRFNPWSLWYANVSEQDSEPQDSPVYMRWPSGGGRHCHYRVNMCVRVNADQYITFMLQPVNQFITLEKHDDGPSSVTTHYSSLKLHMYTRSTIFQGSSAIWVLHHQRSSSRKPIFLITSTLVSRTNSSFHSCVSDVPQKTFEEARIPERYV